jgi:hypothetical protein
MDNDKQENQLGAMVDGSSDDIDDNAFSGGDMTNLKGDGVFNVTTGVEGTDDQIADYIEISEDDEEAGSMNP